MPTQLQFRRGTTAQNNAFTGGAGELSIDTTIDTIRVHDGSAAGGFELTQNTATQTLTNKTLTSPTINSGTVGTALTFNAQADARFADSDSSNWVAFQAPATISSNITWTLPDADGSNGQALVTDGSGTLSWAAAGATISSDTSTNTDFLLYFASSTSGALTAVNQDSGLTYNPSSGTVAATTFSGALSGNATTATTASGVSANSVALSTDTTGNYVQQGATSGNGIGGSVNSEGGTFTVTSNATNANTGSTIVFRDGSGNFSAGTITANLTGNASGSSGSCTGNSATATTATNVTVSANNTANETVYITFVDGATGTQGIETDTGLSYNPSTNVLSTTASAAQYADLAEKYTSDADYDAGTVLVFGGEEEVTQSTNKYDKRIAGIVSTDPAYLMNSESDGITVALLGRVPCKVIGEIRKGDLMVASDTPGHAMAWRDESNPYIGSVIGKALENKTGAGTDVIEVVVGRT